MEEYRLSELQKEQARIYFFEYICEEVEKDERLRSKKEEYIIMLAKEEMPKWINHLENQVREDIKNGKVERTFAERMNLGQILKEALEEIKDNQISRE